MLWLILNRHPRRILTRIWTRFVHVFLCFFYNDISFYKSFFFNNTYMLFVILQNTLQMSKYALQFYSKLKRFYYWRTKFASIGESSDAVVPGYGSGAAYTSGTSPRSVVTYLADGDPRRHPAEIRSIFHDCWENRSRAANKRQMQIAATCSRSVRLLA